MLSWNAWSGSTLAPLTVVTHRACHALSSSVCIIVLAAGCATREIPEPVGKSPVPTLLPIPQRVERSNSRYELAATLRCSLSSPVLTPLLDVLDYEYRMLTGGEVSGARTADEANCRLSIDPSLDEQAYRLRARGTLEVTGGSYLGVAIGTVSFMQALRVDRSHASIVGFDVEDRPDKPYRGLLVDVAREWHDIETLEQLVKLCRWYKINYLQLHFTDNQSFTFPTETLPALPTLGRHYTKQQLRDLDAFARVHGVTLVPELDVPGHAMQLTHRVPELFGLWDPSKNPATINMGREEVYDALDRLIGEIAEVFATSPYIHIGGDEASLDHLDEDPDVQRYLASHDLQNVQELYRHFLVRLNTLVRKHGKRTLLWEGFHKEGAVQIPREITVMAWETKYQLPQDLLEAGYSVINASWKPLYVVNHKKWDPEYIYGWNLYRWENWVDGMPSLIPIQLPENDRVIGASMESWEQPQHVVLPSVRRRLAAMSERTWNASVQPKHSLESFLTALEHTDTALQRLLTPIALTATGLRFPDIDDGHYNEAHWFGDTLTLQLATKTDHRIHYTLDGTPPTRASTRYAKPIALSDERTVRARAFSSVGDPVGYELWNVYELHPIHARIEGELLRPLSTLWEKRQPVAHFTDTIAVTLEAERAGTIRYTLDGTEPALGSNRYDAALVVRETCHVRAQLFDESGKPVGRAWEQRFEKVAPGE
jgi:hexosaminidase